jgi:hypothetical protein
MTKNGNDNRLLAAGRALFVIAGAMYIIAFFLFNADGLPPLVRWIGLASFWAFMPIGSLGLLMMAAGAFREPSRPRPYPPLCPRPLAEVQSPPNCGRNSVVECQLPKLDVVGSNPIARSFRYPPSPISAASRAVLGCSSCGSRSIS